MSQPLRPFPLQYTNLCERGCIIVLLRCLLSAQGCASSKPENQPTFVKGEGAAPEQVKPTIQDGPAADSERRHTEQKRRRVAVASENAEVLASVRWHSALDALKKPEVHNFEQTTQILTVLNKHAIFGTLDAPIIKQIAAAMRTRQVAAGEAVITKGEAGEHFFIVAKGEYKAYLDEAGEGEPVASYHTSDSFGELALLYDSPRAATVKATTEGTLYKLGRIQFRNLVMEAMQKGKAGLEERLRQVAILGGLSSGEISRLAEAMEPQVFADGDYIETMGAVADSLSVILSGEVACHKDDGQELRLAEGAVFGESCLKHLHKEGEAPAKRQAHVVAVGEVRLARLAADHITDILGPLQKALDVAFMRKVLCSVQIFEALDPAELGQLLSALESRHVSKGEAIITQGEKGTTFYVIKMGSVDVLASQGAGATPTKLTTLKGGDFFGERSLLTEEPTVASVVAAEPTELMCLPKAKFEQLLGPLQGVIEREKERRDRELRDVAKASQVQWGELDLKQVLGEGSFGCVRMAIHKKSKTPYALKAMHKGHLISTNQVNNTINEKRVMEQCDHPFILQCHGAFNTTRHVQLLLGLALGGELFTRMSKVGMLKAKDASMYVAMTAAALGFLSARNIAHRDLKLENLLFDEKGYLKLVDFGFAKRIESRTFTFCGTPDYLAPEILSHAGHNHGVDWWTLGVLTYEMLHGEPPFVEDDQMATFKRIAALDYKVRSHVPAEAKDLIKRLLQTNPSKRIGMLSGGDKDIYNHPLCAHIDISRLLKKEITPPWVPKCKDPTDCSNFDSYPAMSSGKKYDKFIDKKYDPTWMKEFGEVVA